MNFVSVISNLPIIEKIFFLYIIVINVTAFIVMGIDKMKAKGNGRRVRERTIFTLGLFGGAPGILFSMILFKHKKRKRKFYIGIPILCLFNIVIYFFIYFYIKS